MISLCMIVKNEIDVLERCIKSVKDKLRLVEEIVIVDTGSTDGTRELAVELGCKVYDFEWCDDFAKARNFSIEKSSNDLVIVLDADEFIVDVDLERFKSFITYNRRNSIGEIEIVNYGDYLGERYTIIKTGRIFNRSNIKYRRKIHEIPDCIDKNTVDLVDSGIVVHHTGYINESIVGKDKSERNLKLLLDSLKYEDDLYLTMHLGKTYIELEQYELAVKELEKIIYNEECVKYTYYTEAVKEYGRCLLQAEKFMEALVCKEFWDRCSKDERYVYFMGHIYFKNGFFENAMDCFINVINRVESSINKKDAMYSLGQMFSLLGFNEESAMYFDMCGDYADALERAKAEKNKKI